VTPNSSNTKAPGNSSISGGGSSGMPHDSEDTPERSFVLPKGWTTVPGSTDIACAANSTIVDLEGCKCTATRTITFEDWSTTETETRTIRPGSQATVFFDDAVRNAHVEVVTRLAVVPATPPQPSNVAISVTYSTNIGKACEMPSVHFGLSCRELKRVSNSGSWYAYTESTSASPSYAADDFPKATVEFVADKMVYTIPKFTFTGDSLTHTNGYAPIVVVSETAPRAQVVCTCLSKFLTAALCSAWQCSGWQCHTISSVTLSVITGPSWMAQPLMDSRGT
jgi:hypothetical protein